MKRRAVMPEIYNVMLSVFYEDTSENDDRRR